SFFQVSAERISKTKGGRHGLAARMNLARGTAFIASERQMASLELQRRHGVQALFRLCVCMPFEQKHRDFAGRFLLILPIGRKYGDRLRKCLFALIASQQSGCSRKRFVPGLNRDIGMSQQVVVPQWVFWCASFGSDREVAI